MADRPDWSIQRPFASSEASCARAEKSTVGRLAAALIAIAGAFANYPCECIRRAIARSSAARRFAEPENFTFSSRKKPFVPRPHRPRDSPRAGGFEGTKQSLTTLLFAMFAAQNVMAVTDVPSGFGQYERARFVGGSP
jgi:hypothetical protein